eukprot:scaffold313924_cov30-Tisochrysis_lutea.AAC.2
MAAAFSILSPDTHHTPGATSTTLHDLDDALSSSSATRGSENDGGDSGGALWRSFSKRAMSMGTFAWEAAESARTRLCPAAWASCLSRSGAISATSGMSILLRTTT